MILIQHSKGITYDENKSYQIDLIGTVNNSTLKYLSVITGNITEFKKKNRDTKKNHFKYKSIEALPREVSFINKSLIEFQSQNGYVNFENLKELLKKNAISKEIGNNNHLIDINSNRIETLEAIVFSLIKSLEKEGILSRDFLSANKKYLTEYENSAKTEITKFQRLMDNVLKLKNIIKNFK